VSGDPPAATRWLRGPHHTIAHLRHGCSSFEAKHAAMRMSKEAIEPQSRSPRRVGRQTLRHDAPDGQASLLELAMGACLSRRWDWWLIATRMMLPRCRGVERVADGSGRDISTRPTGASHRPVSWDRKLDAGGHPGSARGGGRRGEARHILGRSQFGPGCRSARSRRPGVGRVSMSLALGQILLPTYTAATRLDHAGRHLARGGLTRRTGPASEPASAAVPDSEAEDGGNS
jgi:hypothetical protein